MLAVNMTISYHSLALLINSSQKGLFTTNIYVELGEPDLGVLGGSSYSSDVKSALAKGSKEEWIRVSSRSSINVFLP
jgi:hypothetical protein